MELTKGAVEGLEKGVRVGGENVNAIGIDDETGEEAVVAFWSPLLLGGGCMLASERKSENL